MLLVLGKFYLLIVKKVNDFLIFKQSDILIHSDSELLADSGYQGINKHHENSVIPIKKKKGIPRTVKAHSTFKKTGFD